MGAKAYWHCGSFLAICAVVQLPLLLVQFSHRHNLVLTQLQDRLTNSNVLEEEKEKINITKHIKCLVSSIKGNKQSRAQAHLTSTYVEQRKIIGKISQKNCTSLVYHTSGLWSTLTSRESHWKVSYKVSKKISRWRLWCSQKFKFSLFYRQSRHTRRNRAFVVLGEFLVYFHR